MNSPIQNYQSYRWFITKSKKLVIGGKSAAQNDQLLTQLKTQTLPPKSQITPPPQEDYIVMHTHLPSSPFSIILAPINKVNKSDLEETAIFTACFSQQWKFKKKKTQVDIFKLSSLTKPLRLKTGTWQVKEKLSSKTVELKLVLTKQNNILRAVPEQTTKTFLLKIKPGDIDKTDILSKIQVLLPQSKNQEEILQALPSGGISITK